MLELVVPAMEEWDERKQEFIYSKECTLCLEHSLISLSKWEAKWCKPYLSTTRFTPEESMDYVKCMTIGKPADDSVYSALTPSMYKTINDYISAPMSATYFRNDRSGGSNEKVVSELIYYWMISLGIPFECEKWHLTLIKVCQRKSNPQKMSAADINRRNSAINKARRASHHSRG